MPTIGPLRAADHADWLRLWHGYLEFYEEELPEEVTADVFERLVAPPGHRGEERHGDLHGALARDGDGAALGLVHWLVHPSTWTTGRYCYLEDLFVDPDRRGSGVGRALIGHVTEWAREQGCDKVYWITAGTNDRARALYDSMATLTGMVQYEIAVSSRQ